MDLQLKDKVIIVTGGSKGIGLGIMEVNNSFSFEGKAILDANNPKVQEWETLMWKYQKALPISKEGEKWLLMEKIYHL